MSASAVPLRSAANTLASLFSEAMTAILRVRYGKQTIGDPQSFREHMRRLLQTAMQEARNAGYTSAHIQMGVLATVGFLDESVLNLGGSGAAGNAAAAADWSRRPLQEELFGGHIAGETFFQNLASLLREDNSAQVADVLELHCHCLLLGYKGRYAFGNAGELAQLLRGAQEKIARTRGGPAALLASPVTAAPPAIKRRDRWSRALLFTAIGLAAAVLVCFVLYSLLLRTGAGTLAFDEPGSHLQLQAGPAAAERG
ncbi:MAG TPA: DotU family type IV/VI secretion system protein [Acidobacteriaceae bacterium]